MGRIRQFIIFYQHIYWKYPDRNITFNSPVKKKSRWHSLLKHLNAWSPSYASNGHLIPLNPLCILRLSAKFTFWASRAFPLQSKAPTEEKSSKDLSDDEEAGLG